MQSHSCCGTTGELLFSTSSGQRDLLTVTGRKLWDTLEELLISFIRSDNCVPTGLGLVKVAQFLRVSFPKEENPMHVPVLLLHQLTKQTRTLL